MRRRCTPGSDTVREQEGQVEGMGIILHWFLPTSGDSRNVVPGLGGHGRPASIDYPGQVAGAAENLGFDAVLTPTRRGARTPGW
jgi:hypothetical protein